MEYSLDQMHKIKGRLDRRSGKTTDAVVDAIGKLMVTENETVPLVVAYLRDIWIVRDAFIDLCKNHFKETPILYRKNEFRIEGYSSTIIVFSFDEWERKKDGYNIIPTGDISNYNFNTL